MPRPRKDPNEPLTEEKARELEAVAAMLAEDLGPVEIAKRLNRSRPYTNKLIERARAEGQAPAAPTKQGPDRRPVPLTPGELSKARKAKKLLARGATQKEVKEELGLSKRAGAHIIEAARTVGATAMIMDPDALEAHLKSELDVMEEIAQGINHLQAIEQQARNHLEDLKKTTQFDVIRDPDTGAVTQNSGHHQRMANIERTLDLARKLQESRVKAVQAHQKILEHLYDVKRVHDTVKDISNGTKLAMTQLAGSGVLSIPAEQAIALIARCTREVYQRRTGIV